MRSRAALPEAALSTSSDWYEPVAPFVYKMKPVGGDRVEDLITRILSGEASSSEQQRLDRWRGECAENERRFQELLGTWRLAALHAPQERIPGPPPTERIIEIAEQRRRYAAPLAPAASRPRYVWLGAAAAAVVLVAAGLGAARVLHTSASITTTGADEVRMIDLADGSIVRLGPHSRLSVRTSDPRKVGLDGVAFFGVATDSGRPFVVETPVGRAEVSGTRFEIRVGGDSLRLVVVEGQVDLSSGRRHVEARAGQLSRISPGSAPSEPEAVDVWDLLDWPQGLLIFQATPLRDALQEVSAAFGTPIIIIDSTLIRRSVTAWFENESLDEVVGTLCQVVGARCTVGSTIEVAR